jgi:hypothetical protein
MKSKRTKVVYILGHPYSGSTLFSLALGNSKNLVNLGEVSYLENDYREETRCVCGSRLDECQFWRQVKSLLDEKQAHEPEASRFQLNRDGKLNGPDKRHLSMATRLGLMLSVNLMFSKVELQNYARKNESFFNVVSEVTGEKIIIDAAKSPYRLQILLQRTDLDLKVVWLKRNRRAILASKLKYVKRDTRFYNPFLSPLVYIGWLLSYHSICGRIYRKLPSGQKCTVFYEDFIQHPGDVQNMLSDSLNTNVDFHLDDCQLMPILDQHVYVGNRWLFPKDRLTEVQLRTNGSAGELDWMEEYLFQIFSLIFPAL